MRQKGLPLASVTTRNKKSKMINALTNLKTLVIFFSNAYNK
jgi:hypothetical protein